MENPSTGNPTLQRTIDTSWRRFFRDLWDYRQVLYFLVWRDFIVRYKQTRVGLWWAVLNPLLGLMVYWWAFGIVAKMPSDNTPYPLFIFAGLIPFNFVSEYISRATDSLTGSNDLIQKVFFPRIFIPLSTLIVAMIDFGVTLIIMLLMMVGYGLRPGLAILSLPVILGVTVCAALGAGLFLAAANAGWRDISRATALLTRLLLFVSPVFYSRALVPPAQAWLYDLNPLSGVIQGFRWSLLSSGTLEMHTWISAVLGSLTMLVLGIIYFHKVDLTLADSL